MIRKLIVAGALGVLVSCGGGEFLSPIDEDDDDEEEVTSGATATSVHTLEVNKMEYDADRDELVINNLPFDGPDGVYERVQARIEVDGFGVYRSLVTDETGQRQYFAVFRQTDNGAAGVVATPDYAGFGFGGTTTTRNNSNTTVPVTGEYVYRGLYGGARTYSDRGGIELVEGDVLIEVDIEDFDDTGAVEGRVTNRTAYGIDGVPLQPLPTIVFATTSIDAETGVIAEGTAATRNTDGTTRDSGTYQGLFVGPNGEEIVGTVNISGSFTSYRIVETVEVTDDQGIVTEEEVPLSYAEYLRIRDSGDRDRLADIAITETAEDFDVRELGAFTATD